MRVDIPTGSITIPEFFTGTWTCPQGITVIRVTFVPTWFIPEELYVGVTPGNSYQPRADWREFNEGEYELYQCWNQLSGKLWAETGSQGDVDTGSRDFQLILSWSPVINAHAVNVTDY